MVSQGDVALYTDVVQCVFCCWCVCRTYVRATGRRGSVHRCCSVCVLLLVCVQDVREGHRETWLCTQMLFSVCFVVGVCAGRT